MVEPGLKGARDGEVVHGRGHDQHVGGQQFFGEQVGAFQGGLLARALLVGGLHPAPQQVGIEVRHLVDGEVADLDLIGRMGALPLGDEVLGQLAGNGTLLAGAAFDNQYAGHVGYLHRGLLCVDGAQIRSSHIDIKA
ncbi:hypothetical protein D3C72_1755300 [compost metagenome]